MMGTGIWPEYAWMPPSCHIDVALSIMPMAGSLFGGLLSEGSDWSQNGK